jgi:hypothetical protein
MMAPTFALGIPTCADWVPARAESLARLRIALGDPQRDSDAAIAEGKHPARWRIFRDRAPNHVWAVEMWGWAASTDATHFVTLQDDAKVAPNFWAALSAMVAIRSDDVLGLEVVHDAAPVLASRGHRWMSTNDCLVGVGYVVPMPVLREFLKWRASELRAHAFELDARGVPNLTEDTSLALFCMATGRRIYHPLPTIIDHDVALASTYANDAHAHRRPLVVWNPVRLDELGDPDYWLSPRTGRHVGRFYAHSVKMLEHFAKEVSDDERAWLRSEDAVGLATIRRMALEVRLEHVEDPARPRLYACTPTTGRPAAPEHKSTMTALVGLEQVDVRLAFEVTGWTQAIDDLVTTRSRFVRDFLETDCTHLLMVDDDESFSPLVVLGMLATGHDCVAAPAPKREEPNWGNVMQDDGRPPEARAYRYPIKWIPGPKRMQGDCVEVESIGLGCALFSRSMLERMVKEYSKELKPTPIESLRALGSEYVESNGAPNVAPIDLARLIMIACDELEAHRAGDVGLVVEDVDRGVRKGPLVELFRLSTRDVVVRTEPLEVVRVHMGEDASFFARWRRMGGKVWMYLGPGSPVDHHGPMRFKGMLEAFNVSRKP